MFFIKQKQAHSTWEITKGIGKIDVRGGSDVEKQLTMIGLTTEDLDIIHSLQPFVKEKLDYITDQFYKNLQREPRLFTIINNNSSVDRLRNTLKQHIFEMFNGVINDEFLAKRRKIAYMHVKIGLPTKWYMAAFQDLLLSIISIIEENLSSKEDCLRAIKSASKILNFEQQLVLEAYEEEVNRINEMAEAQKRT